MSPVSLRWGFLLLLASSALPAQVGLDITLSKGPDTLQRQLEQVAAIAAPPLWLQLNELPGYLHRGEVPRARELLGEFRRRGHRLCVEVRFVGRQRYAPLRNQEHFAPPENLLTVFNECRELGRHFGDLVDAWEIENEPELGYFWGSSNEYAAVLKAAWLGFQRGFAENRANRLSDEGYSSSGSAPDDQEPMSNNAQVAQPLVLMAPLGLPPGPYLGNLVANDLLAHTDGFNFHYYGYADDFSDVYRRWEETVVRASRAARPWWRRSVRWLLDGGYWLLGNRPEAGVRRDELSVIGKDRSATLNSQPLTNNRRRGALPVFLTEYGYGMLTGEAAKTTAGRLRQARWHEAVLRQLRELRPEAVMAFRLGATREGSLEFGLLSGPEDGTPGKSGPAEPAGRRPMAEAVTPALQRILDEAAGEPWRPRAWKIVRPEVPGEVVLDLIPGAGWRMDKTIDGYLIGDGSGASTTGRCRVRVYNFGDRARQGIVAAWLAGEGGRVRAGNRAVGIGPMQWVEIELEAGTGAGLTQLKIEYTDADSRRESRLAANLGPAAAGDMVLWSAEGLLRASGADNRARLLARTLVMEESGPQPGAGAWLFTPGTEIEVRGDQWTFTVHSLPGDGGRRAMAELPLPDGFDFRSGQSLTFAHQASVWPALYDVKMRTATGNLYGPWRQYAARPAAADVTMGADGFGLQFYGRASRPVPFDQHRPVSLVFQFRPPVLPTTYVISGLRIESRRPPADAPAAGTLRWRE